MSNWIKCDRCNEMTEADSNGDKRYRIGVDGFNGHSSFHLCEQCLRSFYSDFLKWKWNDDESQYVPQPESEDKEKLSWLGKNCKDCGNEKCKKLGTLPKGHDCALWQPESEGV